MDPSIIDNPPRTTAQTQGPPPPPPPAPSSSWNPFQHSLNSSLTVKLDRSNFLAWKSQVIPTVIGHGLDDVLLIDSLSTAGHPMDESDLIMHLLNGLGPEYDPVVVHFTSLVDNPSFESIQSLLLTHESRLERHFTVNDSSSKLMANLTTSSPRFASGLPNSRSATNPNRVHGFSQSNRPSSRYFGRGMAPSRLLCQVCFKTGHTAAVCHYRFDKTFIPPKSGDSHVYLTEIEEEDVAPYSSPMVQDFAHDAEWYADTGANKHVATGMENLDYEIPYHGHDTLAVGDGKRLQISHIGQDNRENLAQREG
uniref:Retrotransposon Copia-like N-terminal domain-containing protein n=1 Tax=Cannabis sativa TaxID=3483 RepID=A0A803PVN2_CANSA